MICAKLPVIRAVMYCVQIAAAGVIGVKMFLAAAIAYKDAVCVWSLSVETVARLVMDVGPLDVKIVLPIVAVAETTVSLMDVVFLDQPKSIKCNFFAFK